jgi:hypothetical protein
MDRSIEFEKKPRMEKEKPQLPQNPARGVQKNPGFSAVFTIVNERAFRIFTM